MAPDRVFIVTVWLIAACAPPPDAGQSAEPLLEDSGGYDSYNGSNTNNASTGGEYHHYPLEAGQTLLADTCNDVAGDSMLRLEADLGGMVTLFTADTCTTPCASGNDGACLSFTAPFPIDVGVRAGCAGNTSCTAVYHWSIAPLDSNGMLVSVIDKFDDLNIEAGRYLDVDDGDLMHDVEDDYHVQGIARLRHGYGVPYHFAISSNLDGTVYFAKMSSSDPKDAEPFDADVNDDADDEVTDAIPLAAYDDSFTHAGAIQVAGQYLAVPYEAQSSPTESEIVLFDVSFEPPVVMWSSLHDHGTGAVGVAKASHLADEPFANKHVMVAYSWAPHRVYIYTKPFDDLGFSNLAEITNDEWKLEFTWDPDNDGRLTNIGDDDWFFYQNLNVLPQFDGRIFLAVAGEDDKEFQTVELWEIVRQGHSGCDDPVCMLKQRRFHPVNAPENDSDTSVYWGAGFHVWSELGGEGSQLFMYSTERDVQDCELDLSEY